MARESQVKVLVVFGTRPEAIKLAPIIDELSNRPDVSQRVCVTGQHRQMLDQVLDTFAIRPDYDLDLMTKSQSPTRIGAAALAKLEPILESERPNWVLVQGDTTTAAATALAAFYQKIRVAHVEAGLRTGDKWQPFPEEVNRRIVGVVADRHFCPTPAAKRNLLREGVPEKEILITGNTAIDALNRVIVGIQPDGIRDLMGARGGDKLQVDQLSVLVTTHRRENLGPPLENICVAIRRLATSHPHVRVIFPVHLNPTVRTTVNSILQGSANVHLIEPLDYPSLIRAMHASHLILTDSGGIQEEAPTLGKPVLVMREVTERPEGVEAGAARLVGTSVDRIVGEAQRLIEDRDEYASMAKAINPYGDGLASSRIVHSLLGQPVEEFVQADRSSGNEE